MSPVLAFLVCLPPAGGGRVAGRQGRALRGSACAAPPRRLVAGGGDRIVEARAAASGDAVEQASSREAEGLAGGPDGVRRGGEEADSPELGVAGEGPEPWAPLKEVGAAGRESASGLLWPASFGGDAARPVGEGAGSLAASEVPWRRQAAGFEADKGDAHGGPGDGDGGLQLQAQRWSRDNWKPKQRFVQTPRRSVAKHLPHNLAEDLWQHLRLRWEQGQQARAHLGAKGLGRGTRPSGAAQSPASPSPWLVQTARPGSVSRTTAAQAARQGSNIPLCLVCDGVGRVACEKCCARGRTNCSSHAVLPKGAWPKWCWFCRGSGLMYCARCLGTGEKRGIMGFHVINPDVGR